MDIEIDVTALAAFAVLLVVGILAYQHFGLSMGIPNVLTGSAFPAMVGGC